jgi:hypothetical protein
LPRFTGHSADGAFELRRCLARRDLPSGRKRCRAPLATAFQDPADYDCAAFQGAARGGASTRFIRVGRNPTQSKSVRLSPSESNQIQPNPSTPPAKTAGRQRANGKWPSRGIVPRLGPVRCDRWHQVAPNSTKGGTMKTSIPKPCPGNRMPGVRIFPGAPQAIRGAARRASRGPARGRGDRACSRWNRDSAMSLPAGQYADAPPQPQTPDVFIAKAVARALDLRR